MKSHTWECLTEDLWLLQPETCGNHESCSMCTVIGSLVTNNTEVGFNCTALKGLALTFPATRDLGAYNATNRTL
eukprot:887008-Pelagomonas_calceolata.AAC.1